MAGHPEGPRPQVRTDYLDENNDNDDDSGNMNDSNNDKVSGPSGETNTPGAQAAYRSPHSPFWPYGGVELGSQDHTINGLSALLGLPNKVGKTMAQSLETETQRLLVYMNLGSRNSRCDYGCCYR